MRYHDFLLEKYEVSDRGKTITFHLIYDYPNITRDESVIRFSNVALYNFSHTAGAIITDILETPIPDLLAEIGGRLTEWNHLHGVDSWTGNLESYRDALQSDGYKAWRVESAIGFHGFIIAKEVYQVGA